jgi:hypothetical protein
MFELPELLRLLGPEYVFLGTGWVLPGTAWVFLGAQGLPGTHT